MGLHTLLGANGTIANALLPLLKSNNKQIRLVSRNPKPVEGTETMAANLLNREAVRKAVEGSEIVFLLVGITYNAKVWQVCSFLIICEGEKRHSGSSIQTYQGPIITFQMPQGRSICSARTIWPMEKFGIYQAFSQL